MNIIGRCAAAATLCVCGSMSSAIAQPAGEAMADALVAGRASAEIPAEDRIYDGLIGSWNVRAFDVLPDGSRRETEGEWHFAWVLEGRAAQDVWISPPRGARTSETSREFNRYGSTLRYYLPRSRTWRVIWNNPVSGAMDVLEGRSTAKGIVQEGRSADGSQIRWIFHRVDERSFHWTGERSRDGGTTWQLEAEFFGVRKAGSD